MEVVHRAPKAAKFASQDFISSMPHDVIIDIMNRLPIRDAVKTGILSRKWRYQWNMVTGLVLDSKFCRYLHSWEESQNGRILSALLFNLKGPITKFLLDIDLDKLHVEEISHWVLFLSRKGIQDLTLNMHGGKLKLSTHLYSCTELKHLNLYNCEFCRFPWFPGFPNLVSLDLSQVIFPSFTVGEFIARCPLLEILKIHDCGGTTSEEILIQIAKLGNLKILSLYLEGFRVTSSSIHQLFFLPKLQELYLNFDRCKLLAADHELLAADDAGKKVLNGSLSLKTLKLSCIDFSDNILAPLIIEIICGSPNLQTLEIRADRNGPYSEVCFLDHLDCNTMGQLHLQSVRLSFYRGSKNEVCLLKFILACSPLLKKIEIEVDQYYVAERHDQIAWEMSGNLLNLYRVSPVVKINLH